MSHQMVNDAVQQEKSFIKRSALLEEITESDSENGISCVTPLQRLIKVVNVMSPKALSASISDMDYLACLTDRVSSSAPLNNSEAAVGLDLVSSIASHPRRSCSRFGSTRTRHSRRLIDSEGYDLNSILTKTSRIETPEHSHWHGSALLSEEIRRINEQLIDTVVCICDNDFRTTDNGAMISEGIIIQCSFVAIHTHSNLISQKTPAFQLLAVHPLKLLVPKAYPRISPMFKEFHVEACPTDCEDLSFKAREKFNMSVGRLPQPFSISEAARTWDVCARKVVSEYAHQHGGGNFSSKYGSWEDCLHASWS